MKDKLYDLTERFNQLCADYDPYGWQDYVSDKGDDVAFEEAEELIMSGDPAIEEYLNEIITEDERNEIISEAIDIKTELMKMHTRPSDREKISLASYLAYSIADYTVDDNIVNDLTDDYPEADVWRTVPDMIVSLMRNSIETLKKLEAEISNSTDPANLCGWLWHTCYWNDGLVFNL